MPLVCKKHKRHEGQQMAHILTLNMYWATNLSIKYVPRVKRNTLFAKLMDIFNKNYFTCKISSLFTQTGSAEKVSIVLQTQKIVFLHLNALYC